MMPTPRASCLSAGRRVMKVPFSSTASALEQAAQGSTLGMEHGMEPHAAAMASHTTGGGSVHAHPTLAHAVSMASHISRTPGGSFTLQAHEDGEDRKGSGNSAIGGPGPEPLGSGISSLTNNPGLASLPYAISNGSGSHPQVAYTGSAGEQPVVGSTSQGQQLMYQPSGRELSSTVGSTSKGRHMQLLAASDVEYAPGPASCMEQQTGTLSSMGSFFQVGRVQRMAGRLLFPCCPWHPDHGSHVLCMVSRSPLANPCLQSTP